MPCKVKINDKELDLKRKVDRPEVIEGIILNQAELVAFSLLASELLKKSDDKFYLDISIKLRETINNILGKG